MAKLNLNKEVADILEEYGATIQDVSEDKEFTEATIEIVNQCFNYTMFVLFNGTTEDFLKNLIDDCYNFDPEDYAEEMAGVEFMVLEDDPDPDVLDLQEGRDIEEVLQDMAGDLYAYITEKGAVTNG